MHYCLFPKFYQKLSLEEMMDRCVECDLDAPCVFVRDGYWVTWENIRTQTAAYMAAAESRGMKPEFASIDGEAEMLWEHPEILGSLADAGIRAVRTGLCQVPASLPIREYSDFYRRKAEITEAAARRAGIRALFQIHPRVWYTWPMNATTAYDMVRGLDPAFIGVMADGGNTVMEGTEDYEYQCGLLHEYLGAMGAKDAAWLRSGDFKAENKGWNFKNCSVMEGWNNWFEIFRCFRKLPAPPYMVLMPFYEVPEPQFTQTLKDEVRYLRTIEKAVGKEMEK